MKVKNTQKKKKGRSVQELMGIKTFTKYGLSTNKGELLFYLVSPTNISVLSHTNIEIKIRHLMMVLSALPDIEIVRTDSSECFDDNKAYAKKYCHNSPSVEESILQQQLDSIADAEQRRENAKSRLDDIYMILDSIKNRPMEYDDRIVRQLLECVVVDSKEQITVIFKGGLKSVQPLTE